MIPYPFYHSYVPNRFAEENTFGARSCNPWAWSHYNSQRPNEEPGPIPLGNRPEVWPSFASAKLLLPEPFWQGHAKEMGAYWKVWELAFDQKLRKATEGNRFVSDFNATAFNDATFMWDSAFIALFGIYGRRVWHFQGTLDNFYCKQHPDGYICREIREKDGEDKFQRYDPAGTGPNVLGWAEWEYFTKTGDRERLARVFPPLAAYTRWFRLNRTWPNGAYWGTGWSTGMDNQPRIPEGHHVYYEHCHQTWVDTCMQAVLADRILVRMAGELGREADALQFAQEAESLTAWINRELWDEDTRFYHDLRADGTRITGVKTIGAYWALLAGVVPADRLEAFLSHLKDPLVFNRPHRVPSLSADTPGYVPGGGYWMGGVWPPSNYMLLCGLNSLGREELAHEIGLNHVSNIAAAFALTGTLWENYAPDFFGNGCSARDFVGWTGIPPVAVLFEQVFGLKAEPAQRKLTWHPRVLEEHGVNNYPFGGHASLDLRCLARTSPEEEPKVECRSNEPLRIELRWGTKGASRIIEV